MAKEDMNEDKQPNRDEQSPTASYDIPTCGPGTEVGHFRIEKEIGRGGMGVVYLAYDSKLDRQVAIKSIPPIMSKDEKVKSRLKREAKLLASLNHPDIATIHDIIEGEKGVDYLILEYIPGDTLADGIARGPMLPKEVLSLSGQIAGAFASAHEHGIVHRDLKPANIKITKENRIKVLDFGIAKAVSSKEYNAYTTVTEPGQLIGTPAYMSPEQARGKPSDERGDIWSFGCVLYEMLTGKPPFEGETASDTLAGVLEHEPDWDKIPQATPANVKVLIRRCLEKDPELRLRHMADVALEIRETVNLPAVVPPVTVSAVAVAQPATMHRLIPVAAAASILTAILMGLIAWSLKPSSNLASPVIVKMSIPLDPAEKTNLISPGIIRLLLSPNGRLLVLGDATDENAQLHIRSMDSFETKPIPGTVDAYDPFFSPDSQWLAFCTKEESDEYSLWRLKVNDPGSRVRLWTSQHYICGGSWSEDDFIFCGIIDPNDDRRATFFQISADGGASKPLETGELNLTWDRPRSLPDGKTIICGNWGTTYLLSRVTGRSTELLQDAQNVQYSHTGHLLFTRKKQLYAVPFDVDMLKPTGLEVDITLNVLSHNRYDERYFSIARNGTLAYVPPPPEAPSLVWVDHQGNVESVTGSLDRHYYFPRLSPDENELAVTIAEDNLRQVWKYDLNQQVPTKLTSEPSLTFSPFWVPPEGNRISYSLVRPGGENWKPELLSLSMDGAGKLEPLFPNNLNCFGWSLSWSPDGRYLAYTEAPTRLLRGWISAIGEDGNPGEPALFSDPNHSARQMRFRPPDGRCIAHASNSQEGERHEIYIKEFLWGNLSEGKVKRVSPEGGTEPCWSRDGSKLFYRSAEGMMEVAIDSQPDGSIEVGERQCLFDDSMYETFYTYTNYDVRSDERFLMVKKSPPAKINVILNFSEELKRLAPPGKK
jgi:eukaryotic-like serine/threonine-protein kinase